MPACYQKVQDEVICQTPQYDAVHPSREVSRGGGSRRKYRGGDDGIRNELVLMEYRDANANGADYEG